MQENIKVSDYDQVLRSKKGLICEYLRFLFSARLDCSSANLYAVILPVNNHVTTDDDDDDDDKDRVIGGVL